MKLFFIRHGETVDNVAGLYAGVRDSALTNHGVEQARLLGEYLAKNDLTFSHIFSSPLSRAHKTAEAVLKPQPAPKDGGQRVEIVKVQDLIEQNFGFYEGKTYYSKTDPRRSGRDADHEKRKNDPGFVDLETKESMAKRADAFLDLHLLPLFEGAGNNEQLVIAVISHGMLLSHLWRRLLFRLPRKSLTIAPEVTAARGSVVLEHLGGWGNTGYLELHLERNSNDGFDVASAAHEKTEPNSPASANVENTSPRGTSSKASSVPAPTAETAAADVQAHKQPVPPAAEVGDAEAKAEASEPPSSTSAGDPRAEVQLLHGWSSTVVAVDSKHHLVGLKRQRGGIGSLAHDEGQKKLDRFFTKRQKTE